MEANSSHDINMKPPPLTSDQLNYLIWRYLQESGYDEAAVKLQRDWQPDPETLAFANRIKGHALVSLVQKGLRYHHLHQTLDENGRASKNLIPDMFFFGPSVELESKQPVNKDITIRPNITYQPPSPDFSATISNTRKHATSEAMPQPATKRSRKTTNANSQTALAQHSTTLTGPGTDAGSAMDVDQMNGHDASIVNGQCYPPQDPGSEDTAVSTNGVRMDSHMDVDVAAAPAANASEAQDRDASVELAPVISTLANGANIGVQVLPTKAAELSPTTTILEVPGQGHVAQVSFQPSDVNVLIAAGEQSCGFWKSQRGFSWLASSAPAFNDIVDPNEDNIVTALAWQPNGSVLAIATYDNQSGQIHLVDGQDLSLIETLPASQRAIPCLKWMPQGSYLVGIAACEDVGSTPSTATSLLLWNLTNGQEFAMPSAVSVPEVILDIDCTVHAGKNIVCAAGDGVVYQCRAASDLVTETRWPSQGSTPFSWTFVRCARNGNQKGLTIAASADSMALWLPSQDILRRDVHDAPITGLQLRPTQSGYTDFQDGHDFATSSMDGTIKLWRANPEINQLNLVAKVTLGSMSPVMALCYSPDGFCLGGAGYDKVCIWNAHTTHQELANWNGAYLDWHGAILKEDDALSTGAVSSVNGDRASSDHCLSWDANGKKLAFGLGTQVAIIDFQR